MHTCVHWHDRFIGSCLHFVDGQVNRHAINACDSAKKELEKACEPLKLKKQKK